LRAERKNLILSLIDKKNKSSQMKETFGEYIRERGKTFFGKTNI
jgi:hypothetical protein